MFCTHYCDAGYRARPGGQTCIANPTWTIWCLPSWTAMLSLCPWRTKAAFIDSYSYPYVSSWEGKDVYRRSRCRNSGTQPSTCLSCWEVRKLKQQRVVNPDAILKFHCDKEKGNHILMHIIHIYIYIRWVSWGPWYKYSFTSILCLIFRVFQFPPGLSRNLFCGKKAHFSSFLGAAFSNSCRLSFQPAVVMVVRQANLGFFSKSSGHGCGTGNCQSFWILGHRGADKI